MDNIPIKELQSSAEQIDDSVSLKHRHDNIDILDQINRMPIDGHTPVKGEDYFTEDDISDIVDEVINRLPINTSLLARLNGA